MPSAAVIDHESAAVAGDAAGENSIFLAYNGNASNLIFPFSPRGQKEPLYHSPLFTRRGNT